MKEYRYTITEEEYLSYCQYNSYADKGVKRFRFSLRLSVPGLEALILLACRPLSWGWYAAAIMVLAVWWIGSGYLFSAVMRQVTRQSYEKKEQKPDYKPISLEVRGNRLRINGQWRTLNNFTFFPGLLVLICEDGSNVIVPQRAFDSREEIRELLKMLL